MSHKSVLLFDYFFLFFFAFLSMDPMTYAQLKKNAGNQDFKNGNYSLAIKNYDEALQTLGYLMQWVS